MHWCNFCPHKSYIAVDNMGFNVVLALLADIHRGIQQNLDILNRISNKSRYRWKQKILHKLCLGGLADTIHQVVVVTENR